MNHVVPHDELLPFTRKLGHRHHRQRAGGRASDPEHLAWRSPPNGRAGRSRHATAGPGARRCSTRRRWPRDALRSRRGADSRPARRDRTDRRRLHAGAPAGCCADVRRVSRPRALSPSDTRWLRRRTPSALISDYAMRRRVSATSAKVSTLLSGTRFDEAFTAALEVAIGTTLGARWPRWRRSAPAQRWPPRRSGGRPPGHRRSRRGVDNADDVELTTTPTGDRDTGCGTHAAHVYAHDAAGEPLFSLATRRPP